MRSSRWLLTLLVLAAGCATTSPANPGVPRVEIRREIRSMETIRLENQNKTEQFVKHARVLDAYVYDEGADEVRYDVLAKAIPQIMDGLNAQSADDPPFLVRIYVVTGDDPNEAWVTSLFPPQLRNIGRQAEEDRVGTLRGLPWGYTQRHRVP